MASNVDVDMAAANADAVAAQMDAMDVERVVEGDDGEMLIEDEGDDLGANYLEDDGSIEDGGDDGTFASLQQVEEQLKAGVEQPFKRAAERDDAESTLATHGDAVYCCAFAPNGDALTGGGDDRNVGRISPSLRVQSLESLLRQVASGEVDVPPLLMPPSEGADLSYRGL